jgi:hypothetical protein
MHGQAVVVVELLATVEALQVPMLAARVETAFNSPSEASPTTQPLEVVVPEHGVEEPLELMQPEVVLVVQMEQELMALLGEAVEVPVASTMATEYGATREAMAEAELY